MHHHHPFQESFWSPTSASDAYPDFSTGFNVLHSKLKQSLAENKVIIEYLEKRIQAEKSHANNLSSILPTTNPFENDIGGGLKRCFEVVFSESQDSTKEHEIRAEDLFTTALDPLSNFSVRYERIIINAKQTVEAQVKQFDLFCKQLDTAKLCYQNKCKALLAVQPHYDENAIGEESKTKLGSLEFPTRDHVWVWLLDLHEDKLTTRESTLAWIASTSGKDENDAFIILQSLLQQEFLKQNDNATSFSKLSPSNKGGFLKRWGKDNSVNKLAEMIEADKNYRASVVKVEKLRTQVEQILFVHYEEMESLELERIQTIKQAFISVAASLSNTIPRCKDTFDNMMLYQETLKPDKDVQVIVEQYRTGQFNPKPILYENYFYGTAKDQLFGVPLEEITRVQSTLVPRLVSQGLSVIESGFSRLYDEEKTVVWTTSLPLDRVHAAREEINCSTTTITLEFDLLLLASLIRLYLMELPECLFTFELYEPCKLLYANRGQQDKNSRLMSLSKLLATLPSPNYHTVMVLLGHFSRLFKELKNPQELSSSIARSFSYILMRPQVESKVNMHDRHPQRLLLDLIENYDMIFTEETYKAQEENSNRPAIIIPDTVQQSATAAKKSNSLDSTRTSTSSNTTTTTRKSSMLSNFMRSSQSTPTSSISIKRNVGAIPMPSSSTLFEDPDEIASSESSLIIHTPPSSLPNYIHNNKNPVNEQLFNMDDVASLDSFFEDED